MFTAPTRNSLNSRPTEDEPKCLKTGRSLYKLLRVTRPLPPFVGRLAFARSPRCASSRRDTSPSRRDPGATALLGRIACPCDQTRAVPQQICSIELLDGYETTTQGHTTVWNDCPLFVGFLPNKGCLTTHACSCNLA